MSQLGNKLQVSKRMMEEVKSDFWQEIKKENSVLFHNYFEKEYSVFKSLCPNLYDTIISERFKNDDRFIKMMQQAEQVYSGKMSKDRADKQFATFCAKRVKQ